MIKDDAHSIMMDDVDKLIKYVHEHHEIDRVYLYNEDAELIRALLYINPMIEIAILSQPNICKIIRCKK